MLSQGIERSAVDSRAGNVYIRYASYWRLSIISTSRCAVDGKSTRMQSCWRGVRRGARFGAFVGVIIWSVLMGLLMTVLLVVPGVSEDVLKETRSDWERWGILGIIGSI